MQKFIIGLALATTSLIFAPDSKAQTYPAQRGTGCASGFINYGNYCYKSDSPIGTTMPEDRGIVCPSNWITRGQVCMKNQ